MSSTQDSCDKFSPRRYWDERLASHFSLAGVGHQAVGPSYGRWMYRLRRTIFRRIVRKYDVPRYRVLDVGSGSGFYLDAWKDLRATSIEAADFSPTAVSRLSRAYPDVPVHEFDISSPILPPFLFNGFSAISAMDVFLHIVDDRAFLQAMTNIRSLLRPGGLLIWSDNYLQHTPPSRTRHVAHRTLAHVEGVLVKCGLNILCRTPMFYLMNQPVDSRNRFWPHVWSKLASFTKNSHALDAALGPLLFATDFSLSFVARESPTTEIMICSNPY